MDDAPLFRHVYGSTNAIADPGRVLQMWSKEFIAMHRENGCFVLTCHPFISGRASRVALIEELVGVHAPTARRLVRDLRGVARWHDEHGRSGSRTPSAGAPREARRALSRNVNPTTLTIADRRKDSHDAAIRDGGEGRQHPARPDDQGRDRQSAGRGRERRRDLPRVRRHVHPRRLLARRGRAGEQRS